MITKEFKEKVLVELSARRENFSGSDAKFAVTLGISSAQYSRVKRGELDRVLSDENWISIARRIGVSMSNAPAWKTANTPVFQFITAQLELCQEKSLSAMLCDLTDIGKTYTAMQYVKTHKNAVYIDCSQVKSKHKLFRKIAQELGVGSSGRLTDVYEDMVFYLKTLPNPLIIFDEAGDLYYEAFLEIKALWNATERCCGFYMMGANGLQEKIRRAINNKKVGYAELFGRFGKRYGKVVPVAREESERFLQQTAAMIIKANAPEGMDVNRLIRKMTGDDNTPSLRRIYTELSK